MNPRLQHNFLNIVHVWIKMVNIKADHNNLWLIEKQQVCYSKVLISKNSSLKCLKNEETIDLYFVELCPYSIPDFSNNVQTRENHKFNRVNSVFH